MMTIFSPSVIMSWVNIVYTKHQNYFMLSNILYRLHLNECAHPYPCVAYHS